ncbi:MULTISPECIES: EAL domain-containing protein [unclassified Thioalkalivibrio]|uniref:EAL domain-containing protein n=1 Tax=unclassified Thioalkalivibrio TaxID=2621013 RepID=UPI00037E36C1|nr:MULTISPECIES: EAL domain-containing protein [unclassified Thioalkalivibrio]
MNGILVPSLYLAAGLATYAALSHLLHSRQSARRTEHRLFATMCALMVVVAISSAQTYQAGSIQAYTRALTLNIYLLAPFYVLFAAFVAAHTRTPARGLIIGLLVLLAITWVVNTLQPYSMQYRSIEELRTLELPWGETVALAMGTISPWFGFGVAAVFLVFGFALATLIRHYRRHRQATTLLLLGGIGIFVLFTVQGVLARAGVLEMPQLAPFGYVVMVVMMSLVLNRETGERLRDSEGRFRALVEQSPIGIQVLTPEGEIRQSNPAWARMHGAHAARPGGNVLEQPDIIDQKIREPLREALQGHYREIGPLPYTPPGPSDTPAGTSNEENHPVPAGERWLRGCIYPLQDAHGEVQDVIVMQEDITAAHRSEDALRLIAEGLQARSREEFFQQLVLKLSNLFDADFALIGTEAPDQLGVVETVALCAEGRIVENFRYDLAETPCERVLEIGTCIYPCDVQQRFPRDEMLVEMGAESYLGAPMLDSHGTLLGHIAMVNRHPVEDVDKAMEILGIMADRAGAELERLQTEEHIHALAYHDALTGLANRTRLHDDLTRHIEEAVAGDLHGGLILIDLDHFKTINDALGHAVGDTVLGAVADRLRSHAPEDALIVRLGGDEFAVVLPPLEQARETLESELLTIAERILEALQRPIVIGERTFGVGASLGCVCYPDAGESSADALRHADIALYQAKRAGRGGVQFYRHALQDEAHARLQIEDGLRQAAERGELDLHYQPQVDAAERLIGIEALLRWQHPDLGAVPPDLFIPVAEETGLIHGIGNWVLEHALERLSQWQTEGLRPPRLALNLSPWQLSRPDFVEQFQARLRHHRVDAHALTLEVTESGLLRDLPDAMAKLGALRRLGVRIALDDFGTGYSSLAYLRDLPVDELKIDKSFVQGLAAGGDRTLIENIVDIARNMELDVIAEGVEHAEQREQLLALGCTRFQGFLFSEPLPHDPLVARLRQ